MTKEEIKAFKPIINSMKLIREYCKQNPTCKACVFNEQDDFACPLGVLPESWNCEYAIALLEEEEEEEDDGNV